MVKPPRRPRTLCCAALSCLAAGCQPDAGEPPEFAERDSAGIRIVESAGDDGAYPRWQLASAPSLDLGGGPGAAHRFERIRGVARLSDGRIVVLDGASGEVHWFDGTGEPAASRRVPGHSPGDLAALWLLGVLGADTVVVWDGGGARVTRFDGAGAVADTSTVAIDLPRFQPWSIFPDGQILATWRPDPAVPAPGEVVFDSTRLLVVDVGRGVTTPVRTTPGVWWWAGPGGPEAVPFTANAVFAIATADILVASGPGWSIERRDRGGIVRERYVQDRPPAGVTRADIVAHRERVARALRDPREAAARLRAMEGMPWPPVRPAWDRLLVDDGDAIWVRIEDPDPDADRHWTVFGPHGAIIGRLRTPVFLEIWQIGADFVIGTGRDEAANEHVWGYRLDRR